MIDVKKFGAVGDGVTDDTAAIERAYAVALSTHDEVHFSPSKDFYRVGTLRIPDSPNGWLVSVFENGLLADGIIPSNNNAFIGLSSNFRGLSGVFLWGPNAQWQQPKGVTSPLLDMAGGDQIYFEGIAFGAQQPAAIHMHDNSGRGCVNTVFRRCSIMGDFVVNSSAPNVVTGFGLRIEDCSLGRMRVQNFGQLTIRGSFLHSVVLKNAGIPSCGDLSVDDCLSEALTNEDFLTVDTSGGAVNDITLRRVKLADTTGNAYLLKHINNTGINWIVNAKIEMIPAGNMGSGLINPSSAPNLLSVTCEGHGCEYVLNQAKSTLYDFVGKAPKGPLQVYGSRYLNPPFQVVQGQ